MCFSAVSIVGLALWLWALPGLAQTNTEPPSVSHPPEPNLQQLITATSQIEQQLQALNRALEQDRAEMQAATTRNADALSNGLVALEQTLSTQRARELEAWHRSSQVLERSNRSTLIMAGIVAGIGLLALLVLTWFQWRSASQLVELSGTWSAGRALGPGSSLPALASGEGRGTAAVPVATANGRLLEALEQLDKRIREFKGVIASGGNGARAESGSNVAGSNTVPAIGSPTIAPEDAERIRSLMEQANTSLNSDSETALSCFDQVLALAPNHTEALVKKGAVLERMHKLNEAIACYDQAIAADSSLTYAYLHKGGLCSRLERFKEALECYEKALRTHEQRGN